MVVVISAKDGRGYVQTVLPPGDYKKCCIEFFLYSLGGSTILGGGLEVMQILVVIRISIWIHDTI